MSNLKRILIYLIWTGIAFLAAFGYMRIILGPKPEYTTGFKKIFLVFYELAFFQIGVIIGSIIALLFILIDIFYLNKRLKNSVSATIIRLLIIIVIAIIVGAAHYILEKIVDVI